MTVGQSKTYHVGAEDNWGNPTPVSADCRVQTVEAQAVDIEGDQVVARQTGRFRLRAEAGGLSGLSNPGQVVESKTALGYYWGDLHAQTASTVGTGSDDEYFSFARDKAHLDFTSHQANDFMVSDEDWSTLNQVIDRYNDPGRFVVFSGYEWSGNTPCGGDHNVIYLNSGEDIYRSSHWQVPHVPESAVSPANPVNELYDRFKGRQDVMLIPHVGGRFADVRSFFDPDLISLVEIVSCWGVFEWMLWDAIDAGHKVGIVCNSDGHKGRPGAEGPGAGAFGVRGGLTCVLAEALTRESVFNALKNRRCYGTTGPRIYLEFNAGGQPMGSLIESQENVTLSAKVIGTAPIEALFLYRGRKIVEGVYPDDFNEMDSSRRIRVSWSGARIRGRARKAQWDGSIRVADATITDAKTFAFDSPADGIVGKRPDEILFRSSTTGDIDGIDLYLDDARKGALFFDSPIGNCRVDLSDLKAAPIGFDFGGMNLNVTIRRYPLEIHQQQLSLKHTVTPVAGETSVYYVKVIQTDGHMAWSSPIFIIRN